MKTAARSNCTDFISLHQKSICINDVQITQPECQLRSVGSKLSSLNVSFLSISQQQRLLLPSANLSASGVSALAPLPPELRELLRQRLGALESQLLRKVAELEEERSQLYNETAAHRQRTESTLNSLLERITELEKSKPGAIQWV